eukprot:51947-Eustigmatos_ZCMA.PRE.1
MGDKSQDLATLGPYLSHLHVDVLYGLAYVLSSFFCGAGAEIRAYIQNQGTEHIMNFLIDIGSPFRC